MDAAGLALLDRTVGHTRPRDVEPSLAELLRRLLEDAQPGWRVHEDETWAHARNGSAIPVQGWKLHVSATLASASDVLRACVPVLTEAACPFKVARDAIQVGWLTHPGCPRENAGKVITCYPRNDEQAVAVALRLDDATRGLTGPRVLSDRCLRPGSLVHYRFGAFTGVPHVTHDGEVSTGLLAPDGSTTADGRRAGLVAPTWARDPFRTDPRPAAGDVLLGGRYAVREAIRHAYRGGVFRATDLITGRAVVVKQARAHVGTDEHGVDVRDRLRNEARVLDALAGTGTVAALVGVFEQDGDLFVAEEDLRGSSLRAWVGAGMADGVVHRTWADTGGMVAALARTVAAVHAAGAVLRDLSPNNVIVTDDLRPVLIDLEFAAFPWQSAAGTRSGTPAYSAPEQFTGAAPSPSADSYSLGALLLHAFTGEDPFLGAGASTTLPDWLARGLRSDLVPARVAELALALCADDPEDRPTVAEVADRLAARLPARAPLTPTGAVDLTLERQGRFPDVDVDDAIDTLVRRLLFDVRPEPGRVARRSAFGEKTLAANVQHGAAGILGVLVQAWRALGGEDLRDRTEAVASWVEGALGRELGPGLRTDRPRNPRGPVGLYFGWSGPCWALAETGAALGDDARVERAVDLALTLPRDWPGPDVTHGVAGLGLTLVRLWQLTEDPRLRRAVDHAARHLLDSAHADHELVSWSTPASVDSTFAGARFHGFAHGAAGIGTFLDHAADVTGREEYAALADRAADTLRRSARHANGVVRWCSGPDQPGPALPHWCNGSSGVGTFLLRRASATGDAELLDRAARATVAAKWHSGIAYCHGLSGNADFLLDLADRDARYRSEAADLLRVMWERRTSDGGGVGLTDEIGRITPDFNVGYGGALSVLLRLRHGGPRLWLPEPAR